MKQPLEPLTQPPRLDGQKNVLSPEGTTLKKLFLFQMQNLPSLLCGHVLDPNPGDKILDMCAAPGGKTSHLAEIVKRKMRGKGNEAHQPKIIGCDKSQNKIDQVSFWVLSFRLGPCAENVQTIVLKYSEPKCSSAKNDSAKNTLVPNEYMDRASFCIRYH